MENIVMLVLGIVISVMGIVNMTGNISTIHSYNRRKVKEEDIPKYGRLVGMGTLIIGASVVVDCVLLQLSLTLPATVITVAAIVVGLALILYAQIKYNKGIF